MKPALAPDRKLVWSKSRISEPGLTRSECSRRGRNPFQSWISAAAGITIWGGRERILMSAIGLCHAWRFGGTEHIPAPCPLGLHGRWAVDVPVAAACGGTPGRYLNRS